MNDLIDSLYRDREVFKEDGSRIPLDWEIDVDEGRFIHRIIREDQGVRKTLEVGCANGLSSLHICDALRGREGASHIIIDPFQNSQWHGAGLRHLGKAGIDFFELIEERSEFALPDLVRKGEETFDFVFIDGWHTLDHTLIDCFYATRLLRRGGYLVIDDVAMLPVWQVARYLASYPCYKVFAELLMPSKVSPKRKLAGNVLSIIPRSLRERVFHPWFRHRIFDCRDVGMIALQKISNDQRNWDWYPMYF